MVMRSEPALKGPQQFAIVFASLILSIGVMAVMIAWMGLSGFGMFDIPPL